ncbi:hypothetical protein PAECIP111893_01983 [Paenibacillus plantiphilus]|uniref:Uncharacterized protein n=1 Tax=Paenibacillus plantiphilus TaxID=2905650 RepID=A0ABM9C3W9_9BACL|nr:hypothetical protein PAECIP111893_01983 [Paenibacillus plantiphilus]
MFLEKRQRSPLFPEFHHNQSKFNNSGNNSDRKNIPQRSGLHVPFNHQHIQALASIMLNNFDFTNPVLIPFAHDEGKGTETPFVAFLQFGLLVVQPPAD